MVASIPHNMEETIKVTKENHPSRQRFEDIENIDEDAARLLMSCQNHVCTNFCMQKRQYK